MLRVAVITDYFPTSIEPWAGHSAYQTLRILARHCDMHVFYPNATYPALLAPAGSKGSSIDSEWSSPDVKSTIIPFQALPFISRPFNGFSMAHALLSKVRAFEPDILLSYVVYPAGYAAVSIAERLGIPVILTAIGSDLNRIPDPLCRRLTQSALRRASYIFAVSEDLCVTARSLGAKPETTRRKLNGCDTSIFHPAGLQDARIALGLDSAAEIVLYVGRLDVRKGLIELIHAVTELRMRRPKLHCYLLGSGPACNLLLREIAALSSSAFITLVPPCLTSGVAQWMAAADLVTLPSYKEGCPNVIVEALSSGRPVVATNVGGIPELMDDTCGRLVPTQDIPALTQALQEVLDETWDPVSISAKHSRSWADLSNEVYDVLQTLVAKNRSSKSF